MSFTQLYKSTDSNAPVLTGQVGKVTALLDAILLNGYTTASVTSIVEASTTYTVTLAVANATLVSGNYIKISGASPGGMNGVWGPITVSDSTHFTFVGPGGLGSITGTILYAKAPLNGWTSPYTSTNAAVYRAGSGLRHYLQVIDNGATAGGAKEAQAIGFETMSAYNTGTGLFPTAVQAANGLCWRKSNTADATARAWTVWGDDKTLYLFFNDAGSTATTNAMGFGEFSSYKSSDAYNSFIAGTTTFNSASPASGLMLGATMSAMTASNGFYIARGYPQIGSALNACLIGPTNGAVAHGTTGGLTYPNAVDSGYYCAPVMVGETGSLAIRGRMRGMFAPIHNAPLALYDTATGITGLTSVTLTTMLSHTSGTAGQVAFDSFGTW